MWRVLCDDGWWVTRLTTSDLLAHVFSYLCHFSSLLSYHCYFTDKAATKIQAVYRGHKVRVSMKRGDSSSKQEAEKSQATAVENGPTKEELEAEFKEDDKGLVSP